MAVVQKERTLRVSTRKADSPYRVHTDDIDAGDILRLTVCDEHAPEEALAVFEFGGDDLSQKDSIHFHAGKSAGLWRIEFRGIRPLAVTVG